MANMLPYEMLPYSILMFGAIVVVVELLTKGTGFSSESIRIIGFTLVVILGVFLAIAFAQLKGSENLAAAGFTVLGMVAGYLAGK
jgi:hypothetical protein